MAKRGKTLPARRQRTSLDDSLLIRSAESLGRMIGSLQRQLDGATRKLPAVSSFARLTGVDGHGNNDGTRRTRKAKTTKASKGARKSGASKVGSTTDRASKRAAKSAGAKKSAGRSRSGASRKAAKTTRRT